MKYAYLWSKCETRQWTITLFIGTLCVYAARNILPICAISIAKEYQWSKSDSGTVLSCFFWGYAVTQILGGWLADRYGGENVLLLSSLFWIFTTLFTPALFHFAQFTSYPIILIVILRVVIGASQGFHYPCIASLVSSRLTASEKGRVFGISIAGAHVGTVVCGSVGSFVLDMYGWRCVFYLIGLLGFIWWMYIRCISMSYVRQLSDEHIESGSKLLNVDDELKSNTSHQRKPLPWIKLFKHPAFWAAFCAQYCGANAYFILFSWMPSYFSENYPEARGWVFNVVPNLAVISTAVSSPYIATRLIAGGKSVTFTRKLMEGVSLLGLAICLFVGSDITSFLGSLFIFTFAMAFRGAHHGGVVVNPQDFAPNHTGAVFGVLNTAAAIPGFVGVYMAGWILQFTHSWSYVFIITAVQCLCGMVVYVLFGTGQQII